MFISYAQNFEDVILWRALKHVEQGAYIDIGAQDPIIDSVSRGFYEKGWRGLHVEPTATYAQKLRDNRPDEEVVQAAIGNGRKEITFFEIPGTGLSTGEPAIAETHKAAGAVIVETTVPLMPLSELFDRVAPREVHWLKIDVEGMEQSVLESWSPSTARPWVVVVEATSPNSQIPTHESWEPTLLGFGYEFVYFDGLSRYYLAFDRMHLRNSFGVGPNIFDGFAISGTAQTVLASVLNKRIDGLENDNNAIAGILAKKEVDILDLLREKGESSEIISKLKGDITKYEAEFGRAKEQISEKDLKLAEVYRSFSWRITAPYRAVSKFLKSYR